MKVIALHRRRKFLTGIELEPSYLPENARLDPMGLLALDTELLDEKHLREGAVLSEEEVDALFAESEARRAKSKALWLLSRRDHSSGELKQKLRRDFPTDAVNFAVERCLELNLINDRAYAERLATQLIEVKGISPKTAPMLMAAKGLPRELCREVVAQREDDPKEGIRSIIEKKYKGKLQDQAIRAKAFGFLARRGFSYGDISAVMREFGNDCEEFDAL